MAHVLLVDDNPLAQKALRGILARGGHRVAVAGDAHQAMQVILRNPGIDLIITEIALPADGGFKLIHDLKANRVLRFLPVVIYAQKADRSQVKRALDLRVQNFRMKPFVDDEVFAELEKAEVNPWRARHFEEERSFCRLMGLTPDQVHRMLTEVGNAVRQLHVSLDHPFQDHDDPRVHELVHPIVEQAEAAGAWCVVEVLNQIREQVEEQRWTAAAESLAVLDYVARLVDHWIDPAGGDPDFLDEAAENFQRHFAERQRWLAAPAAGLCPLEDPDRLKAEATTLPGCPVIDTAAASFKMLVNGEESCISPVMDLAARDPGLTVQMLIAAQRMHPPRDEFGRIEDARLAVGQLGEKQLLREASQLIDVPTATFDLSPNFDWVGYWTFQRGVARLAQLICGDLQFRTLELPARNAAQLHDVGLLLLARLRPAGFQAILTHARLTGQSLRATEKLFLGCTTPELAAHFLAHHGLSKRFVNVLRWRDDPAAATEDQHLVAIISLARDLCRHNEVGHCGEAPQNQPSPLEETPEWAILREGLYPSFNLRRFELRVHAYCGQLRHELSGHETGTIGEVIARSAS